MYCSKGKPMKILLSEPTLFINYYLYWANQVAYMKIFGKKRRPEKYAGKRVMDLNLGNEEIKKVILSGEPFMAGRFGSNELNLTVYSYFKQNGYLKDNYPLDPLVVENCGFFPKDPAAVEQLGIVMLEALKKCDILCVWYNICEDFFAKQFGKKHLALTHRKVLDFWNFEVPWTSALKGKKVLVIHPLDELIQKQYAKRRELFSNENILPEFDLKTLKSVQTIAGTKDERFDTWFEALDYMYNEAMKIDFDIAIIGCGAYGFPLAAKIREGGKQAIHMGGVTQILFGIKGNRWENDAEPELMKCVNDSWRKPDSSDIPQKSAQVEGSCYW